MSVSRIASRYAKSLLDLASEGNVLDTVLSNIKTFKAATENRDFLLMLKSPIINRDKKKQIIDKIFGEKFEKLTNAFMHIILRKGREAYLPDIADAFIHQYKKNQHISTIFLTTATALDEDSLREIKSKLLASTATDQNVEIISKVDPNIIGGFVIEFEDKLYNASVAHKLEQLRKEFKGNAYVNTM